MTKSWAWVAAVAGVALSSGCTTVRVTQREGCWVRQTERFPRQVTEEVGPCAKPEPKWADDRITRIVQECVAHEDYRWQTHAVQAWSKNQPIPEQKSEGEVLQSCVNQAAVTMVSENEALKNRLNEVAEDRAQYKRIAEDDRTYFKQSNDKIATALGEAAKKPAPAAVATATSNGTATTQSSQTAHPSSATASAGRNPALTMAPNAAACEVQNKVADRARPAGTPSASSAPECDPKMNAGVGGSGPISPAATDTTAPETVVKPIPMAPSTK